MIGRQLKELTSLLRLRLSMLWDYHDFWHADGTSFELHHTSPWEKTLAIKKAFLVYEAIRNLGSYESKLVR